MNTFVIELKSMQAYWEFSSSEEVVKIFSSEGFFVEECMGKNFKKAWFIHFAPKDRNGLHNYDGNLKLSDKEHAMLDNLNETESIYFIRQLQLLQNITFIRIFLRNFAGFCENCLEFPLVPEKIYMRSNEKMVNFVVTALNNYSHYEIVKMIESKPARLAGKDTHEILIELDMEKLLQTPDLINFFKRLGKEH